MTYQPEVLGLDLSITATGVALPDGKLLTIKATSGGDHRLVRIEQFLRAIPIGVDLAVIEDLPTQAMSAGITGMVHGVVRATLINLGIPYVLITPATLKAFATGKGNADKTAMALAAFKRAGLEFGDDNQCDAFWLRAAGLDRLGFPLFDLPAAQRERLAKVSWPNLAVTS